MYKVQEIKTNYNRNGDNFDSVQEKMVKLGQIITAAVITPLLYKKQPLKYGQFITAAVITSRVYKKQT